MYPFRMAIDYRVFDTFLVTVATVYSFVNHAIYTNKEDELFIYTMVESAITFITWIYYLVLSITATRFPLPNALGWKINVHLCILYTLLLISAAVNLVLALWYNLFISLVQSLPLALPVLFTFDLIYTTSTLKNGSPFLDENGKPVNGYSVESIVGVFFFQWLHTYHLSYQFSFSVQ